MSAEMFWRFVSFLRGVERASLVTLGLSLPLAFFLEIPSVTMVQCWVAVSALLILAALLRLWLVKRPPAD